jgi:hypothetical protein
VKLHPEWWTSWGFEKLDEELMNLTEQMNLEQIQDDKMLKVKEVATSGQHLSLKGMVNTLHLDHGFVSRHYLHGIKLVNASGFPSYKITLMLFKLKFMSMS